MIVFHNITEADLVYFVVEKYEQCAFDMKGWSLEETVDFICDSMTDKFGPASQYGLKYSKLATETLKDYF